MLKFVEVLLGLAAAQGSPNGTLERGRSEPFQINTHGYGAEAQTTRDSTVILGIERRSSDPAAPG